MYQLEWNNRIGLFGTSGTGKSWYLKWIIKKYIKENKRRYYVIIDDNMLNVKEYKKMGFHVQIIDQEIIEKGINYKSFIKYHEKIVFVIENLVNEEVHYFLDTIGKTLYSLSDSLLAIDEAHYFVKPGRYEPLEIIRYLRGGRKQGSDFIISSHRTTDVSPDVISLLNVIISLRVNEINTVERLALFFDQFYNHKDNIIDQDLPKKYKNECNKIITAKDPRKILQNLPNRYFLYSDLEKGIQEISTTNNLINY